MTVVVGGGGAFHSVCLPFTLQEDVQYAEQAAVRGVEVADLGMTAAAAARAKRRAGFSSNLHSASTLRHGQHARRPMQPEFEAGSRILSAHEMEALGISPRRKEAQNAVRDGSESEHSERDNTSVDGKDVVHQIGGEKPAQLNGATRPSGAVDHSPSSKHEEAAGTPDTDDSDDAFPAQNVEDQMEQTRLHEQTEFASNEEQDVPDGEAGTRSESDNGNSSESKGLLRTRSEFMRSGIYIDDEGAAAHGGNSDDEGGSYGTAAAKQAELQGHHHAAVDVMADESSLLSVTDDDEEEEEYDDDVYGLDSEELDDGEDGPHPSEALESLGSPSGDAAVDELSMYFSMALAVFCIVPASSGSLLT